MDDMSMNNLMMINKFLGGKQDVGEMMKLMQTAQSIGTMMNSNQAEEAKVIEINEATLHPAQEEEIHNRQVPTRVQDRAQDKVPDKIQDRQIQALSTAIPFLDKEYQKSLYMVVKFMEVARFKPEGSIMAMDSGGVSPKQKRANMIKALSSYMSSEEREKMNAFLSLMDLGALPQTPQFFEKN